MYIYGGVRLVPAIVAKSFSLGFVESAGDSGGRFSSLKKLVIRLWVLMMASVASLVVLSFMMGLFRSGCVPISF
jgi:hypothetical protein